VISDGTPVSFQTNSKIAYAYSRVYTRSPEALTLRKSFPINTGVVQTSATAIM